MKAISGIKTKNTILLVLTVLFAVIIAQGVSAQEAYLDSFVTRMGEIHFDDESSLTENSVSPLENDFACGAPTNPHEILRLTVRNSDFCAIQRITGVSSRPVRNPTEQWIGLAGVSTTVLKIFYGLDVGSVDQIWYHVDVPGLLSYPSIGFKPEHLMERDILVLGRREDGFDTVGYQGVFLVDDKQTLTDIHGEKIDSAFLWDLIEARPRKTTPARAYIGENP